MDPTMKVAVGWTIVGGFVFTMIVTCLSLVGLVRFADRSQQKRLFALLIVEVVVGAGASALDFAQYDARDAGAQQQAAGRKDGERDGSNNAYLVVVTELLNTDDPQRPPPDKRTLEWLLDQVHPKDGTKEADDLADAKALVAKLPSGKIDPSKANEIRVRIPAPKRPPIRLTPPPPTKTNVSGSK